MRALNLKIENQIAILEFDQPDSKVNLLNSATMQELAQILNQLAQKSQPEVRALIITSRKDGSFIAGADIKEIEQIHSSEEAKEKSERGKQIFNLLQNLDLVTLAMINGDCLGGGLELALACQYRVASFSDRVKIGLPEVKLGLVPGWGGTQRLPRLIGLAPALKMILSGQIISGREALKYGLVDRLFSEARLKEESFNFVRGILEGAEQVTRKPRRRFSKALLENNPLGRAVLFHQVKKDVLKKTKGFYPAPLKALELIKRTYGKSNRNSFLLESEIFSQLAITQVSKNLIKVFYLNEKFKKFPWVGDRVKPSVVNKCGIVGAGLMGGGIAHLTSSHDIPTRIKDVNFEPLKKALKTAREIFDYSLRNRKLKKNQVEYKLGLISPTVTYQGFENTDIVIEAVVEDLSIKQKVFKELSQIVSLGAVLVSNTSALSIRQLAEATSGPERMVGLHFFNPVHRMPLVEIIKSEKTSNQTLATVIAFARGLGKTVIVVQDRPGFLVNRILFPYLNEAAFLLEEGMQIEKIDRIARRFGMPLGPLELADEVGIDVGYKVAKILQDAFGDRMRIASVLDNLIQKGLLGKKSGHGFYLHTGKRKIPNPEVYRMTEINNRGEVSDQAALKRMIYTMLNEAARCLEEKVVNCPETIDMGMIAGIGFPPFRAGLLRYADSIGIEALVTDLVNFQNQFGQERFRPCDLLLEKSRQKQSFYTHDSNRKLEYA